LRVSRKRKASEKFEDEREKLREGKRGEKREKKRKRGFPAVSRDRKTARGEKTRQKSMKARGESSQSLERERSRSFYSRFVV